MPRSPVLSSWFLDHYVFVKQVDLAGFHECAGDVGGRRVAGEILVFGDALPVAIVAEEMAWFAIGGILAAMGSRIGNVFLQPPAQGVDPVLRKGAAEHRHAVALELVNPIRGHAIRQHSLCPRCRIHQEIVADFSIYH